MNENERKRTGRVLHNAGQHVFSGSKALLLMEHPDGTFEMVGMGGCTQVLSFGLIKAAEVALSQVDPNVRDGGPCDPE